jgi:hypothetical protein
MDCERDSACYLRFIGEATVDSQSSVGGIARDVLIIPIDSVRFIGSVD